MSNLAGEYRTVIAIIPETLGGPSHIALDHIEGAYMYVCVHPLAIVQLPWILLPW